MDTPAILAVVEADLHLIGRLRTVIEQCCGMLKVARSSKEAILYLRGVGVYGDRKIYPLPVLIVLDNQNSESGDLEVLRWVREESAFQDTCIAILSSKPNHSMHARCALDRFCYIVDRQDPGELADVIVEIPFAGFRRNESPANWHQPWHHAGLG